jgi:anti-sigma B factor antagonist
MTQGSYRAAAERGDEIQILPVQGELDLATADHVAGQGLSAIGGHARLLLLDLSGLSFCDPYGLRAFVRIANQAETARCHYGLVALQPPVVKMLGISGLDRRIPTFPSIGHALAHFTPRLAGPGGAVAALR